MEIFVHRKDAPHVEEGFSAEDLPELLADESNVVWVDMEAATEADEKILSDVFHFHPLTIEDARETRNQPKIEPFPDYLFFIFQGVKIDDTTAKNFVLKELDGYLGKNYVVTYHHENFRSIDIVKQQIRSSPFICSHGADYLLHQILDQLVDLFMPVVDDFDILINKLEDRVFRMKNNNTEVLVEIMNLKRNVARLRRISTKQLQTLYRLAHGEFPLIDEKHLPFFRDVQDHLQRISDLSESYRDLVSGLLDIHLSVIANRTNDVMKVLAVFSAIILPLSLIAGIYGMNFENIPELHTRNGYFVTLAVMFALAVLLLFYFWRKGWIFQKSTDLKMQDKSDE
ncbi:MAG: magnesium/cobalt transporter CorA [Pyrinomonadaceae bacterium]